MNTFRALTVGAKFDQGRHDAAIKLFESSSTTGHAARSDSKSAVGSVDVTSLVTQALPPHRHDEHHHDGAAPSPVHQITLPQPSVTVDIFGNASADGSTCHTTASGADGEEGVDNSAGAAGQSTVDKPLKSMTLKKMRNLWRKHELDVMGVDVPAPIEHFSDLVRPPLNTPRHVVTNLFQRHHRVPTPVQMQAIPALIQHHHVLACAPTGSGKTIAFLVPLFALLAKPDPSAGVRALVITPTVELAQQIEREAFFLMKGQRWRFVQHGQTTRNKDIFISTPGRVVSLLQQKLLDLSSVRYLVFDEGDRLWDHKTDFLALVDTILAACSFPDKVVCLFTATLSERVERAARSVMGSDPVRIIVRGRQTVNRHIRQKLVFCTNELGKVVAMRHLIREGIHPPVLIFVQSIERTKELYEEIRAQGLHMALMNAKMSVEEREDMVTQFRLGSIWMLVTTELLARGIDFKNVNTVINFDFPTTVDSYIHRVGRTGRAGKTGQAITFFTEEDRDRLPGIAKVMKESGSEVEDWMLEIKVDRATRQRLERSTPHRTIVSTRKRMLVADQRLERQYRRLEAEQKMKESKRAAARQRKASGAECASHTSTVEVGEPEDE